MSVLNCIYVNIYLPVLLGLKPVMPFLSKKNKDIVMKPCPFMLHSLGHLLWPIFWKLFRISFCKALGIMGWMCWISCFTEPQLKTNSPSLRAVKHLSPWAYVPMGLFGNFIALRSPSNELPPLCFLFSSKNDSFVTLMQVLAFVSLLLDSPHWTILPFWKVEILGKAKVYVIW